MQWVLLACVPGLLALLWHFGWGSLLQLLVALPVALGCEALVRRLRRQAADAASALFNQPLLGEGSALVSATLLALALPPYAPWWLTACACAFGLLFGLRRWWWQADSYRPKRFRLMAVLLTMGLAWGLSAVFEFPHGWGIVWAGVLSSVVQLSSAWTPPASRIEGNQSSLA